VLNREQLMRLAWGENFVGTPKAVDVTIQRVRKKIQPHLASQNYIQAQRGFGYKFAIPGPQIAAI
jgi:DNA-binding response OmpR family regulator